MRIRDLGKTYEESWHKNCSKKMVLLNENTIILFSFNTRFLQWPMSQPGIAAMPPCHVTEHLQPAGMTAASCRCLPIVAQLKAPIDSQ